MYPCQEMLGTPVLRFLVTMWCSVVLLESSVVSQFTVSISSNNRQYFLDVTMMIESAFFKQNKGRNALSEHTANHTITFPAKSFLLLRFASFLLTAPIRSFSLL